MAQSVAAKLAAMYATCVVNTERVDEIDRYYVNRLTDEQGRRRYERVGDALGIPWWFVGVIHGLESAFEFSCHLHNGDPLTDKTVRAPRGRPASGEPPFEWEESAEDALCLKRLQGQRDWSI